MGTDTEFRSLTADELRAAWFAFFEARAHVRRPSASLVPENDPTLLFTGAGMNQFKDILPRARARRRTGARRPSRSASGRATSRTSAARRGTSPSSRCWATSPSATTSRTRRSPGPGSSCTKVAAGCRRSGSGSPSTRTTTRPSTSGATIGVAARAHRALRREGELLAGRRARARARTASAVRAPRSTSTTASAARRATAARRRATTPAGSSRSGTSSSRSSTGRATDELVPLPQKNIDCGVGFERIARACSRAQYSPFETSLFRPIVERGRRALRTSSLRVPRGRRPARRRGPAPHAADRRPRARRVLPRRRRREARRTRDAATCCAASCAARSATASSSGSTSPFLGDAGRRRSCEVMGGGYPELREGARRPRGPCSTARRRSSARTYDQGVRFLEDEIARAGRGRGRSTGADGLQALRHVRLPASTSPQAHPRGARHRRRRRRASRRRCASSASARAPAARSAGDDLRGRTAERPAGAADVAADRRSSATTAVEARRRASSASSRRRRARRGRGAGDEVTVVLDRTPFYAESGGQVGDCGVARGGRRRASTCATRSARRATSSTRASCRAGALRVGSRGARASWTTRRRDATRRNHTATHLLHAALKQVLGEHVRQEGSLVAPRPPALRLQPSAGADGGGDRRRSRTWSTPGSCANDEVQTDGHGRSKRRRRPARCRSSARSTATSCASSPSTAARCELCGGTHVRPHRRHRRVPHHAGDRASRPASGASRR